MRQNPTFESCSGWLTKSGRADIRRRPFWSYLLPDPIGQCCIPGLLGQLKTVTHHLVTMQAHEPSHSHSKIAFYDDNSGDKEVADHVDS